MPRVDLRLLKAYGLSLNTRKRYFIVYCPMTWRMEAVYDDLSEALKHYGMTVDAWHQEGGIGMKGFFPHVSVWDLLTHLHNHITADDDPSEAIEYTVSRISGNLQSYPEAVVTSYVKI